MAVKSGKNSLSVARFRVALTSILAKSGQTRKEFAQSLGIPYSTITSVLNGSVPISIALMDEFAEKIHCELSDILSDGRAILAGEEPGQAERGSDTEGFTDDQIQAIEAFKVCLKFGGEGAEMLARQAIDLASKKQADSGFLSNAEKRRSA